MATATATPQGLEVCYSCGGQGFIDAASFGEQGWHSCYKCGETGYLPAGTEAREADAYEALARDFASETAAWAGVWEDFGPEDVYDAIECGHYEFFSDHPAAPAGPRYQPHHDLRPYSSPSTPSDAYDDDPFAFASPDDYYAHLVVKHDEIPF